MRVLVPLAVLGGRNVVGRLKNMVEMAQVRISQGGGDREDRHIRMDQIIAGARHFFVCDVLDGRTAHVFVELPRKIGMAVVCGADKIVQLPVRVVRRVDPLQQLVQPFRLFAVREFVLVEDLFQDKKQDQAGNEVVVRLVLLVVFQKGRVVEHRPVHCR